ncbi:ArsI/CadI family heavy metal resistance metalloenzyme [Angustibacter sp. McL0619]|uniref:ArsI/CadI family heavy metal resistance metalloenzyme n=1 Tax=Angustibacter sp. McL0619 TaxID=3415676 RepID=UPI003CEC6914
MSRIQLALNVESIDEAVQFYSTLFDTRPAKRRPGYANFAVENPALKLVLFENPGKSGTLNHLGVERASMDEIVEQAERLESAGLTLDVEGDVVCCYARQDKHWVTGPDGQRWENYVVLADAGADLEGKSLADVQAAPGTAGDLGPATAGGCCGSSAADGEAEVTATTCCAN